MKIKICGIRTLEDVTMMNTYKPDYTGFIFAPSKRQISLKTAKLLSTKLNPKIKKVGVFVDQPIDLIRQAFRAHIIDFAQLHGNEDAAYEKALFDALCDLGLQTPHEYCIKAFRIDCRDTLASASTRTNCAYILLDAFSGKAAGGTGKQFCWDYFSSCKIEKPFFLAGGICLENADFAIEKANPFALDVSSSLETNGKKDMKKVQAFMEHFS